MATPTATEMRDLYLNAEAALLAGKSFQWGDRTLTRENLAEIREGRQEWERRVAQAAEVTAGRPRGYALADFSR